MLGISWKSFRGALPDVSSAFFGYLGVYRDNGKENGNYSIMIRYILGLYRGSVRV